MADSLSADALLAALRAEGATVVEVRSWRTHNRNSKGAWGPVNGVLIHHTVTSGTEKTVDICYDGYAELPGPLCHGVIGKNGTVYLVGNGRANHAGGGDPDVLAAVVNENYGDYPPATHEHQGSTGAVDGNAHFYGFECENLGDGKDPWPALQLDAIERAAAALCRAHGWSSKSVIGHLEWSDWKSDPKGFSMVDMRARIAERLNHAAGWTRGSTPPEEDNMALTDADVVKIWSHLIPNRFRLDAAGKPALVKAETFLEFGDGHYDQLRKDIAGMEATALTDAQVQALADKVAAAPGLADAIAEKVAAKLAARLAQ